MIGKFPLAVAAFTILASSHSFAAEKEYLPIDEAVATLADGRPWTVNAPDGKKLSFTLKADRTGSIRGPCQFLYPLHGRSSATNFASLLREGKNASRSRK